MTFQLQQYNINDETLSTNDTNEIVDLKQLVPLGQWICGVDKSFEMTRLHSTQTLTDLNTILGPLEAKDTYTRLDNVVMQALAGIKSDSGDVADLKEVVFKIEKAVFVEAIDFYQKATNDFSSVVRIEVGANNKWTKVYESGIPMPVQSELQLFSPKLMASSGKSDSIKVFISGDIAHLDGIEVRGSLYASDLIEQPVKPKNPLDEYALLSRELHPLISNDMFSDVVFEVEGRKVPAHRNILVARSNYFRAMLSERSKFSEAKGGKSALMSGVYIGDITHEIFGHVLNYIYTGHVNEIGFTHATAVEVMRAADKMNLVELEKLCIFHISNMLNADNVCTIYKQIHEKKPVVESLLRMCYDQISTKFAYISQTEEFCSLPQDLMIQIIENVVPKLSRITSVQVNELDSVNEGAVEVPSNVIEEVDTEGESEDEDETEYSD